MKYYYLISGLPDLSLDEYDVDMAEVLDTIQRNLTDGDEERWKYIILSNDIRNFLNIIFEEYYELPSADFLNPALISTEQLRTYRKNLGNMPDFINTFIQNYEGQLSSITMREAEEILWGLYFEEVHDRAGSYINAYYDFDAELRSIISALVSLNNTSFDRPQITEYQDYIDDILRTKSMSSDRFDTIPYSDKLEEQIKDGNPLELEKVLDRIRWDYLSEVNAEAFSPEYVYAYTFKLMLTSRWHAIETQSSDDPLARLIDNIKEKVHSPKTPVI